MQIISEIFGNTYDAMGYTDWLSLKSFYLKRMVVLAFSSLKFVGFD